MRALIIVTSVIALVLSIAACQGDAGPAGEQGPPGPQGAAGAPALVDEATVASLIEQIQEATVPPKSTPADYTKFLVRDAPGPPPPVIDAKDEALVREVIATNPEIQAILHGMNYEVQDFRPAGVVNGTAAHIVLESAITSDGPWKALQCQQTRQQEDNAVRTNVKTIRVIVADTGQVLEWAAIPSNLSSDRGSLDAPVVDEVASARANYILRDLGSGDELYSVSRDERSPAVLDDVLRKSECPSGFEDD